MNLPTNIVIHTEVSRLREMCTATLYHSIRCGHKYLALDTPCAPGKNLTNCHTFQHGVTSWTYLFPPFPQKLAPKHSCPWCDKKGDYDMEYYRVVTVQRFGTRIGLGPSRRDPGFDTPCICLCEIM